MGMAFCAKIFILIFDPLIIDTAYHVDNNKDVFFKEIMEGIYVILIGKVCSFDRPLVIVGGKRKYYL